MENIYAALLLHKAGKEINEANVKSVVAAAGIEADESRLIEQVAVAVELTDLKHDIWLGYVGQHIAYVKQQEKFLSHADVKILLNLFRRERAIMDGNHSYSALPLALATCLIAEYYREVVSPACDRSAWVGIKIVREAAIDIYATTVDRIEIYNDMLQCCLQVFVCIRGRKRRSAIQLRIRRRAGVAAAVVKVIVIKSLAQREVTSFVTA